MKFDGFKKSAHQINKIRLRPLLLAKIARGYFRTLVLKRPTLRICEFSITSRCQSRCSFCYASKFDRPNEAPLSLTEIKNTWTQAKLQGAFSSIVFGGEPLLHPNFMDIIALLEPRKHIVTVTTNAIALTEDLVVEMKKMGVFLLNLSLNSLDPEVNDRLRGYPGHHDRVMQAIAWCRKHRMDVFLPVATAKPYLNENH
jgi:MoaA/NifB/PqqE/SkfB family radical SAM enzyme